MSESRCGWCGKALNDRDTKRVPDYVRFPAAFAGALTHGGLWIFRGLAPNFCRRCRAILTSMALLGMLIAGGAALAGLWLWLRACSGWKSIAV